MAKLFPVTVMFILFNLTLLNARIPSSLPENDITNQLDQNPRQVNDLINREVQIPVQKSDVINPAIRLPREISGSKSDGDSAETATETTTLTITPLNMLKFHPINRHFRLRSALPFRLCHHHHHHHYHHDLRPLGHRVEIPYGDDMILSGEEKSGLDPTLFPSRPRKFRPRWVRIHHSHHHYHHHDDDEDAENDNDREFSRIGVENFRKNDEKMKKEKDGGFLKHFRKFLNQFEF